MTEKIIPPYPQPRYDHEAQPELPNPEERTRIVAELTLNRNALLRNLEANEKVLLEARIDELVQDHLVALEAAGWPGAVVKSIRTGHIALWRTPFIINPDDINTIKQLDYAFGSDGKIYEENENNKYNLCYPAYLPELRMADLKACIVALENFTVPEIDPRLL